MIKMVYWACLCATLHMSVNIVGIDATSLTHCTSYTFKHDFSLPFWVNILEPADCSRPVLKQLANSLRWEALVCSREVYATSVAILPLSITHMIMNAQIAPTGSEPTR